MVKKQSFLSNLLSDETYDNWTGNARVIIASGTVILLVLFGLSYCFYSSIISFLLKLVTGTSLLFIVYMVMWLFLLDIKVDVDEPEQFSWETPKETVKPIAYKLSSLWTVVLVILGILAIYFTNKYREQYSFECDTFWVDKQTHLYHLDWTECETSEHTRNLEEIQGYLIPDNYSLCEECKEIAEEAGADYERERYFRR